MSTPAHWLYLSVKDKEVDKPDGGSHGREAPYILFLSLDGRPALQLTTSDFKVPGQLAIFAELLGAISTRDVSGNPKAETAKL